MDTMSTACSSDQDPKPAKSHQEAFEYYASLGPGRTYRQVAEKLGVSLPTVKRWAKENSWISRVDEREAQIARHVADRAFESEAEDMERKRKLVKAAFIRLGQAIAQGKIKMQLSDLDRMIRLDALLQGKPDGVLTSVIQGAKTVDEFRYLMEMTPPDVIDGYVREIKERARLDEADPEGVHRRQEEDMERLEKYQNGGARR
jgi:predicted transcriptional regulator